MAKAKWVGQARDDLLFMTLAELKKRYPQHTEGTLKGKRAYWRAKQTLVIEGNKMENQKHLRPNQAQEPELSPNSELAVEILSIHSAEVQTLREIYQTDRLKAPEIRIETPKDSFRSVYINEALLGNEYADIEFLLNVIDNHLDNMDLIVVSGIMQGDFKMNEKRRQGTLKPELSSMDTQFAHSREILRALSEKGPVIYNLGNDDMRICEDYTIEYFRKMFELARESVNYYQQDKIKQHPLWQEHYSFQISHAFPYCLRAGRRLRSAEEMKAYTEDDIEVEEYMMLYDTVKRLERGEEPNPDYAAHLDMDCLGDTEFRIADDFDLKINANGEDHAAWVRHHLNFSSQPMYGNHMLNMVDMIGERASRGQEVPYMLVTQHNLEEVGVFKDGCWALSGGGFLKADMFLGAKGRKTNVPGDPAKRLSTTRRRIPSPSASSHERFNDGRHLVTVFNEELLKKADSCPRTALPLLTDWQIGSLTARPDLLIKYLDYIQTIQEDKILYLNGDFVQGRNYPNFPNENQELGLISMDAQIAFVRSLLSQFLRPDGVTKAYVTPGNHEWNSGTEKWHGYSFTQYIQDALKEKGIPNQRAEGMMTRQGEKFKAWASVDYVGDYGVYVSHLPLLKGAKGASGLPIYQAAAHSKGVGDAKRSIDFEMYGHWHHPQYGLFGDKLAVISGSLAGLSGYEWMRGYRPVISSVILHVGGGAPPQLEFLNQDFMENWQVEGWSDDQIKAWLETARKQASRGEYTELR